MLKIIDLNLILYENDSFYKKARSFRRKDA